MKGMIRRQMNRNKYKRNRKHGGGKVPRLWRRRATCTEQDIPFIWRCRRVFAGLWRFSNKPKRRGKVAV